MTRDIAAECFKCGEPATDTFGNGYLCADCQPNGNAPAGDGENDLNQQSTGDDADSLVKEEPTSGDEFDPDFATPESGVWPIEWLEREQWMGHVEKKPFAPWADRDHPEAASDGDARWKWGLTENYADGETVAMAEADPRLDGRAFLQQADDPYAYVDGDDVRDPETGDVHPTFLKILKRLGGTYTDVSQSGGGSHAVYRGGLPKGVKQAAWQLDDEPFGVNEDLPSIEIYAGKRVCVATGEHVPGTPTEIYGWDDDALEGLLDEYDQLPTVRDVSTDREDYDFEDYTPTATEASETTDDIRDIFAALDRLDAREVADRTIVREWNDDASTSAGKRAFIPTWGSSSDRGTANIVDEQIWQDTGDRGGYGGSVVMALIRAGELSDRGVSPSDARGSVWFEGLEQLRELGFNIPRLDRSMADGDSGPARWPVETCTPPQIDRHVFDVQECRQAMQEERYDNFLGACAPVIWGDEAGAGKTTNAAIAAAERDRPHAVLFQKHEKAREFILGDVTPDEYFHLKGGAQKQEDACMDADHADEECPDHGHPSNCASMCPIKDLDRDDDRRQKYEAIASEVGERRAHLLFGDDLMGHDDEGECAWLEQFDAASRAERLVGVHEYQTLKTVQRMKSGEERDVIVDETPRALKNERTLSVPDVTAMANALTRIANVPGTPDALDELARFADDVQSIITDAPGAPDSFAEVDPPGIEGEEISIEVDPDDLSPGVDPEDVEYEERREYPGAPGEGYRKERIPVVKRELVAEALARAKLEYGETTLSRMGDDEWKGEPLAVNAILAAAAEAGLDAVECRRAIAAPSFLDGKCPRCGDHLQPIDGTRCCASGDGCGWNEETDYLVARDAEPARAQVYAKRVADDSPAVRTPDDAGLVLEQLPMPSDLPARPLVLDATATPAKVAALYGVDETDVRVDSDETMAMSKLNVTQVLDGQYHAGTITDSETVRERIQRTIDLVSSVHQHPLFVAKKALKNAFEFPEDAEVIHYGGNRGMNYDECDAVVCIGAPHPKMKDLQREADLLSQGRPIDAGGEEYSTRRDAPNPPVFRKLDYTDDDGRGRAVPTKHYSGLVGELFRETREKELVQSVHRIRGLLTDDMKHAYLLTNVPTDLQVDEVCTFEELADPVKAVLPITDGAVELAEHVEAAVAGRDVPDGFRVDGLVRIVGGERDGDGEARFRISELHNLARYHDMDVTEKTIRRWVDDLKELGLLIPGEYEQHRGVPYEADLSTLTSALSVLHYNDGVKVAVTRRICSLAEKSANGLAWLRCARDAFGFIGDPDALAAVDPPPG